MNLQIVFLPALCFPRFGKTYLEDLDAPKTNKYDTVHAVLT